MERSVERRAGWLPPATLADNFADIHPPLDLASARLEASRCYFCYDAPCITACPTGINIPSFIRKISTSNIKGAGLDILKENIFGGACARVCPTEELCEQACVRTTQEHKPVAIGALQRYATDWWMAAGLHPFQRAAASGKRVAVVGAGPAGLACAHGLAVRGHDVVVFEAKGKPGGLNEYGIAAYKVPDDFAGAEVDFILAIGGIEIQYDTGLGRQISLAQLRADFDAVFLGLGQAGINALGLEAETIPGVENALDFIERLRQAEDLTQVPVGRRVVVIGGGNTAVDAAVQSRRLGAESVAMVYRRGPEAMGATWRERDFALTNGVAVKYWARPTELIVNDGHVTAVRFEYTKTGDDGRLVGTGETYVIEADMVLKAIGQHFLAEGTALPELSDGRIAVDADGATSLPGVYAGGDCVAGADLTVQAVQDGKVAACAIDRLLAAA